MRYLSWTINAQKTVKWPFPVNSSESGMPTGHRKLEKLSELIGKLWKSYRKAIGRSSTGLQSRQILTVQQFDATRGLPSVKDSKRRRQRRFSAFFSFNSYSASKCTRALLFWCCARSSARKNFPRRDNFRDSNANHEKNTMKLRTCRQLLTVPARKSRGNRARRIC